MTAALFDPTGDLSASPARSELYSWAAARETFKPSKLVQAWLETHGPVEGKKPGEAVRAALELQALGTACLDALGGEALRLPDSVRSRVLGQVGAQAAASVLAEVPQDSLTLTEGFFRDLLQRKSVAMDRGNRPQLVALGEALRWASAAGAESALTQDDVRRHLARYDFLQALGGDDLHRFVGRGELRRRLGDIWHKRGTVFDTVLVEGPGGVGKSLGIARFIADLLESGDPAVRPDAVFHLDFDRVPLQQANSVLIVQELIQQAMRWGAGPADIEELQELSSKLGAGRGPEGLNIQSRGTDHKSRNLGDIVRRLTRILGAGRSGRFVFFADSFEQVEQYDDFASRAVNEVCQLFSEHSERVLLVYAARVFLYPEAFSKRRPIRLGEFTAHEADIYLANEASRQGFKIGKADAKRVRDTVGKTPLALRLAVGLLEQAGGQLKPEDWDKVAGDSPELIQALVYDRLLRRLKDTELKRIALPSLLLRRITAPVIAEVLAGPCQIMLDMITAEDLMARCRQDWRLFTPVEEDGAGAGSVVRHRQDVRSTLLPNLDRALGADMARTLNENAVRYYMAGRGIVFRTEELYHRLRLGQGKTELDKRWDDRAAASLRTSLAELPASSRSYLRSKLGAASRSGFVAALATLAAQEMAPSAGGVQDDSAVDEFRLYARKVLQSGEPIDVVLEQLQTQKAEQATGPLADIYAVALMRSGQHDRLLQFARELAAGSSGAVDAAIVSSVLTVTAGLLEGKSSLGEAQQFWIQGLRKAEALKPLDVLPCLVGSIRVRRKLGNGAAIRAQEVLRAVHIVDAVDLRQHTVLARETSAELGELLLNERASAFAALIPLITYVFEINEAYPSAAANPDRVSEIGLRVFKQKIDQVRTLNSLMIRSFFSSDIEVMRAAINVMREEVDWTLRMAAGELAPLS